MKKSFSTRRSTLAYLAVHIVMAAVLVTALLVVKSSVVAVSIFLVCVLLYLAVVKRFDYLDPLVGFLIPWLTIAVFSIFKISSFAVDIHRSTYLLLMTAVLGAIFAAGGRTRRVEGEGLGAPPGAPRRNIGRIFLAIDVVFLSLTALNIAVAGYVPLLRGLATGDTGYLDFGIHGVYGFYLALANALAILNLIVYLRTGKLIHLFRFGFILFLFLLLVTRQNLISVFVESIIAYCLIRGRIKWRFILANIVLAGVGFSVIGSFRSGNIKELAAIEQDAEWIPDPVIWLYAYSYFNIANVDKLIRDSNAPYYNASSLSFLIPSFLRPKFEMDTYLLVPLFNVSSYMYPVYADVGTLGVLALTVLALGYTARRYRTLGSNPTASEVGTYCVLYFCASFSFFYNFWFFLPVIFQIVFFKLLGRFADAAALSPRKRARLKVLGLAAPHGA